MFYMGGMICIGERLRKRHHSITLSLGDEMNLILDFQHEYFGETFN